MREKSNNHSIKISQGQTFPLTIKRLGINGEGVGHYKRQVVFVPGALPGEEIVVEATKIHPKYAEGKVKKIRKQSPFRVKPPCPIYEECGGCQLQHLAYEQQLKEKRDIVIQAMERHTKLHVNKLDIRSTIGMEDPWNYRNKSQFQVGQLKNGKVIAGLYGQDSHRLVPIQNCMVQHPLTNKVSEEVKQILEDFQVPIYDERKRKGIVRTIVTRAGFRSGEVQVVLITTQKEVPRKKLIMAEIQKRLPEVKSLVQNINGNKTSLIFGEKTLHLSGEEVIQETLGDLSFELSARAFFQLNPVQTVKLYDEVKKAAGLTGQEKIADAYCGVGTIGMWLASGASEVRGMDTIEAAIIDAQENAKRHGIDNATYVTGTAEHWLPKWVEEGWKPDVVVVDPPRTGCDQKFLDAIKKVKPKKFVYVSCNPSTLAKDIEYLAKDYKVEYIQPVDMFPHTAHVECVAQLTLI
ncbi:23S rRNA (uracil(1939)-C(5))-methyltransferase RlmD [Metabacillus sediminilitoris]|uniref:23S rRNA (Uracil(1939)-C(5))-methyltransferase RlmD n=1 Tax=Metabacillus sediminilitoris TaxID=2567941 RepID=A0A4V3WEY6_9BACI|nr:23S rRNA (uracil(1939)-C(5))-methyltransferase RlmD [Metabacillus sediminilitoris]QGQ44252.1 23S rRNA (uracil(1939)-C(5))-methyltransferase RlmD [Metabacillus sediminilitoris]THF78215.1 23S rRNA (uracil(1939)-C(5))-methyltransferase RlmD [Metabacillus sediminilitoris]